MNWHMPPKHLHRCTCLKMEGGMYIHVNINHGCSIPFSPHHKIHPDAYAMSEKGACVCVCINVQVCMSMGGMCVTVFILRACATNYSILCFM